jgi:hypothetical protein
MAEADAIRVLQAWQDLDPLVVGTAMDQSLGHRQQVRMPNAP